MADVREAKEAIAALARSSAVLRATVEAFGEGDVTLPSYDRGWSIAQVLSHLGSGAEIFAGVFRAAAAGEEAPPQSAFAAIWAVWDAKTPEDQARDYLAANEALVDLLESFDDDVLEALSLELFGARRDAVSLCRMTLSEHALHSWDVAVALDPASELLPEAVPHLLEHVRLMASWAGKPAGRQLRVAVHTSDPEEHLVVEVDEHVVVRPAADGSAGEEPEGTLELPAAAFVRLVSGRLDPGHTPAGVVEGVLLDDLRAVFPGI